LADIVEKFGSLQQAPTSAHPFKAGSNKVVHGKFPLVYHKVNYSELLNYS